MISNIDEKKTIQKTFRISSNKLKDIEEYMKLNSIKDFSKFIDSLINNEIKKEKTLFSV